MFLKMFCMNLILIFSLNQILDYNLLVLSLVFLLSCRFFNFMNPSFSKLSIGIHCWAVFSFILSPPKFFYVYNKFKFLLFAQIHIICGTWRNYFYYFILCNFFCQSFFIVGFRHFFQNIFISFCIFFYFLIILIL